MSNIHPQITIRQATDADAPVLERLAERDSRRVPRGSLLVAFEGGELMAAVSTRNGSAIADPFRSTSGLVEMLRIEAGIAPAGALNGSRRFWSRGARPGSPSVPGFPVLPGETH